MAMTRRVVSLLALLACWLAVAALRRRSASSPSRRPRRPSSRACSRTCCRRSRRRPASTCTSSRVGTGQALDIARRGDADVVFVHDQAAEEKFVAEGYGVKRFAVMYNDFVLVGPEVATRRRSAAARTSSRRCSKIAAAQAPFVSRGDRSGTHMAELRSGRRPGIDIDAGKGAVVPRDRLGHGPGAQHRGVDERLHPRRSRHVARRSRTAATSRSSVEGDKRLFNQYGVMLVNPAKHPHVKKELGQTFVDWLVSPRRADDDRRLQDRRRAAVLPERREMRPAPADKIGG